MRFTKQQKADIENLIHHSRCDIDYGVHGSYGDGETLSQNEVDSAKRAIAIIEAIIKA